MNGVSLSRSCSLHPDDCCPGLADTSMYPLLSGDAGPCTGEVIPGSQAYLK